MPVIAIKFPEIENNPANNNALFDHLINTKQLKNDAALAKRLEVAAPVISKIRTGKTPVGASMIVNMHETFDISIKFIKHYLAHGQAL